MIFTLITFILMVTQFVAAVNITYDHRGLLFDGQPKLLISGSIHYPRSTPQMWPHLIAKAKDGGLDVIQTYVFWNAHEPQKGVYKFEHGLDIVKFLNHVKEAGLYASLRIGPYINAEWNFGGFPAWLYLEPGAVLRTNNTIFMNAMQKFTAKIVQMMKDNELFAWQGGPVIIAQIENEFEAYKAGTASHSYAMWAANMAVGLNSGVPWIMCKQPDAPDPVINTYNGGANGDTFEPNAPYKPKMWTESYTGWFQTYGEPKPIRSEKEIAFQAARFFQANGSFFNYYMYHGGTNFGRSAGGPLVITSYDYDAPLDEFGLLNQPKWDHLKELHQVIKLCGNLLLSGQPPTQLSNNSNQEVIVFSKGKDSCAAFLSNLNKDSNETIKFNGSLYNLPARSVSILPDCKNVAFNTAQVRAQTNLMQMTPAHIQSLQDSSSWSWSYEPIGTWGKTKMIKGACCQKQVPMTADTSDYLWYLTSVDIPDNVPEANLVLDIASIENAAHIFVNEKLTATVAGTSKHPAIPVHQQHLQLQAGTNQIAILSMTVGLQSGVRIGHMQHPGVHGPIAISGLPNGTLNLTNNPWTYQAGLQGEHLKIFSERGINNVNWTQQGDVPTNHPMIWYKTNFTSPSGAEPLALNLLSMGKGQAWVNGHNIGRYWVSNNTPADACNKGCEHHQIRCYINCGQPSQQWYHVPRSWLKETGNLLVVFEEMEGDPTGIRIVKRSVDSICVSVGQGFPSPLDPTLSSSSLLSHSSHFPASTATANSFSTWAPPGSSSSSFSTTPETTLKCPDGQVISAIRFASFGTPGGICGAFKRGSCHSRHSSNVVQKACRGKASCTLKVSPDTFADDPCPEQEKTLSIEAACASSSSIR